MKNLDRIQRMRHLAIEKDHRNIDQSTGKMIQCAINNIREDLGLLKEVPVPDKLIHGTGNSPTKSHKRKK